LPQWRDGTSSAWRWPQPSRCPAWRRPTIHPWSSGRRCCPASPRASDPTSENDCVAGRTQCVDAVIREIERRFRPLADRCDHDAIFSLTYLRTTQVYRRTIEDPHFFEDTAFVNHEDVVFARAYSEA